jgi:hypothetical protein
MWNRTLCVPALIVLSLACAPRPHAEPGEPAPQAPPIDAQARGLFPIDSATLAALSARLERVMHDSSLWAALSPSNPRVAALLRDLEVAQEQFARALATPDSTGRTLHERLTARADSVLRRFEERNRQAPRP